MSLVSGTNYTTEITTRKNTIINGNFDVWQRGTSFAAIANNTFTADRFRYEKSGTMVHTLAQSTDVPTYAQSGIKSNYSLHADVTTADVSLAAGDYSFVSHRIEGYDYAQLAGGNTTLSFWVKASKTGIHCVAFRNLGFDRSYIKEYSIATADTWQKITMTVPLTETGGTWDYTNDIGLAVSFIYACGTTFHTTKDTWQTGNFLATSSQVNELDNVANNFRIAQVQLERGETATDIETRHIAEELALCQRYYEVCGFRMFTAPAQTSLAYYMTFIVNKRATPTVTYNFSLGSDGGSTVVDTQSVFVYGTSLASGNMAGSYIADAEL